MPRSVAPLARLLAVTVTLAVVNAAALPAQETGIEAPSTAAECLGLAFGPWTPALDAVAGGHRQSSSFDTSSVSHAPNARDWALRLEAGRDTTLMLFPVWWPVGVAVRVPAMAATSRDTLSGTATALVADARIKNPTATVLLWRVPCGQR